MDYKALQVQLNNGVVTGAYLFVYSDDYIASGYVRLIRDMVTRGEFASMNRRVFEDKKVDADALREALYAMPVMGSARFVLVRCDSLSALSGNPGVGEVISDYISSLAGTQANCVLIVLTPKADKRLSLYKAFASGAKVVEFPKLADRELTAWVNNRVAKEKSKITPKAVSLLLSYCDYNGRDSQIDLGYVKNEIDKLVSFAGTKTIDEEMIASVCSENVSSDIFKYTDSLLSGDFREACKAMWRLSFNKVPMQLIIYNTARVMQNNALWRNATDRGESEAKIASRYGANPYVVKKTLEKSRMSASDSLKAISEIAGIDMQLKTSAVKDQDAFMIMTKKLCSLAGR